MSSHISNDDPSPLMTQSANPKQNENVGISTKRHHRLALIAWTLIHNNVVTAPLYLCFQFLDFLFQAFLILCVFVSSGTELTFDTSSIDRLL